MFNRKMELQKQPNDWSCLPTAFAMTLDMPVEQIIEELGHDGSEVIFPNLEDPYSRRSFHPQELLDICILRDYGVIPVEREPSCEVQGHVYKLSLSKRRLDYYLVNYTNCILIGTSQSGKPHAVAWNGERVFDPNGKIYGITNFCINMLLLIVKINITK